MTSSSPAGSPVSSIVVLTPAPAGGAGVLAARTMRLSVVAGELVLTRPDGRMETLCAAAAVRRVVHIADGDPRWIIGTEQTAWELPDDGWSSGWLGGRAGTPTQVPRTAGHRLAVALGVTAKFAGSNAGPTPAGRGVRVVRLDPRPRRPWFLSGAALLCVGAWAFGLGALLFDAIVTRRLGAAAIMGIAVSILLTPGLWLAATAVIAGGSWLTGRRFAAAPAVPGAVVLRPGPAAPVRKAFVRTAWLLVSPQWVVLRDGFGREGWLEGPMCGGITTASVTRGDDGAGRQLALTCADGREPVVLPLADWAGTPVAETALVAALRGAGIGVVESAAGEPRWFDPALVGRPDPGTLRDHRPRAGGRVDVVVPTVLGGLAEGYGLQWGVSVWTLIGAVPLVAVALARCLRSYVDRALTGQVAPSHPDTAQVSGHGQKRRQR